MVAHEVANISLLLHSIEQPSGSVIDLRINMRLQQIEESNKTIRKNLLDGYYKLGKVKCKKFLLKMRESQIGLIKILEDFLIRE